MWHVYILECEDESLYTGITKDLARRFEEHQAGKGGRYTRSHFPLKVVYSEVFRTHRRAARRESEIKSWSREGKLTLIKG